MVPQPGGGDIKGNSPIHVVIEYWIELKYIIILRLFVSPQSIVPIYCYKTHFKKIPSLASGVSSESLVPDDEELLKEAFSPALTSVRRPLRAFGRVGLKRFRILQRHRIVQN